MYEYFLPLCVVGLNDPFLSSNPEKIKRVLFHAWVHAFDAYSCATTSVLDMHEKVKSMPPPLPFLVTV